MAEDERFHEEQLGTAARRTPRAAQPSTVENGEDAATVRPGGGDAGGVVGRDDLEGDIGADVSGATGPMSEDAGFDEDVPGADPEPRKPDPNTAQSLS